MKKNLFSAVVLSLFFVLLVVPKMSAQIHGGAVRGGGARHGGGGVGAAPFGAGSVVHRNVSPPAGMSRPNLSPTPRPKPDSRPSPRPNLPSIPNRPKPSPHFSGGDAPQPPRRPAVPGGHGNLNRPGDRPGPTHMDGPDWKRWPKIDSGKIHDTVVNKIDIDRKTVVNVRNHFKTDFGDKNFWSHDWFKHHPGCWHPVGPPPPPPFWWHHPDWHRTWGWFATGFFAGAVADTVIEPVPYYYGNNIIYEGDTVYVNGVPYVDADEYYRQARTLAEAGAAPQENATAPEAETVSGELGEWLPMGTFAIASDNKQVESKRIVQIVTNKQGQIRGNIVDMETDKATGLYGSVDSKTQRVAFKVRGHEETVAECGLWNLTQETVPLLVHLDENRTEERTLIRLHEGEKADPDETVSP